MTSEQTDDISIPLCIGKPDDGSRDTPKENKEPHGATFSRFVLPFAYKIEAIGTSPAVDELHYEINSKENLSFTKRRKYFTQETGVTLYDRSIWLDMSDNWEDTEWGKSEITVKLRDKEYLIGMLPPRITLFEAADNLATLSRQPQHILKTGFLSVDIFFPQQKIIPELDNLLMLNEYFRYFGMPYDDHADRFKDNFGELLATYQQDITIKIKDQDNLSCYFERWANLLEIPVKENGKYYRLFPKSWGDNARAFAYNKKENKQEGNWQIYADNRCYSWVSAVLENGGATLQKVFKTKVFPINAKDYGHWIKLLNIDNPEYDSDKNTYKQSIDNHNAPSEFEREWADQRTYKRWEHAGSWYGYSYHSGAALTPQNDHMNFHSWSSYYFDTSQLLFYIRISLFRFSHKLTTIFKEENHDKKWRESLQTLRKEFSKFTVLYQFPLLSNQQQSLEMYALNRKCFDIEDFFKEIQSEINNTHNFMVSIDDNELAGAANKLARFGIPLAAGGLLAGIFGMNPFNLATCWNNPECSTNWDIFSEVLSVVIITIISWFVMAKLIGGKK